MPAVGDDAPAIAAKDHTGADVTLETWAGKRVILWFYPKADTPG
jgi:thioredoxin-dependent peroxiredoxin